MSLQLIEEQIKRFLVSSEPEVICITGRWGGREDLRMEQAAPASG